jgi:hypothetical protein
MVATAVQRTFIQSLGQCLEQEVLIRGWVYRLRVLAKTTWIFRAFGEPGLDRPTGMIP